MAGFDTFKMIISVQVFYAICITILAYTLPPADIGYTSDFSNSDYMSLKNMSDQMTNNLNQQSNVPVVELGALVFYSSNFIVDLVLNFLYAVPQMIGMLIHGITIIFSVDTNLWAYIQGGASVAITIFYIIGIIQIMTTIRARGTLI